MIYLIDDHPMPTVSTFTQKFSPKAPYLTYEFWKYIKKYLDNLKSIYLSYNKRYNNPANLHTYLNMVLVVIGEFIKKVYSVIHAGLDAIIKVVWVFAQIRCIVHSYCNVGTVMWRASKLIVTMQFLSQKIEKEKNEKEQDCELQVFFFSKQFPR